MIIITLLLLCKSTSIPAVIIDTGKKNPAPDRFQFIFPCNQQVKILI